jgi:hypothetical protein
MRSGRRRCVCLLVVSLMVVPHGAAAGSGDPTRPDLALDRMQQMVKGVQLQLSLARRTRDTVKTLCLADKLSRLELAVREARRARDRLPLGGGRFDADSPRDESVMSKLAARAQQLSAEANLCIGEEMAFAGQTHVTTTDSTASAPAAPPPQLPIAPVAQVAGPSGSPYSVDAPHEASMLAYTAEMTLAVFEVAKGLAAVDRIATDLGGYLLQRADLRITVRVPRPRFAEAVGRIETLGDVLHRDVAAEDVTDEYVDLELRLKNARGVRDRLMVLMSAASVKDAMDVERELAKVTEDIERIEGRLKVLRDRVGFSTITVLFQAPIPAPVRGTPILPFDWLDTIGLASLLDVPKGQP